MDFVSTSFVQSLNLRPCTKPKHNHSIPSVEGVGGLSVPTHGVYHLKVDLVDRWGCSISFTRPFVAIQRSLRDSPVLLGRPILKDLSIIVDNEADTWEFKRKARVEVVRAAEFQKDLRPRGSSYCLPTLG